MSADLHVPEAMVEAAARAEYATDMAREESDDFEPIPWEQALPFVQRAYCDRARAGLTAALGVCEVHEERRARWPDYTTWPRGVGEATGWTSGLLGSVARGGVVDRRLVITTPAEQVDTEEAPK